MPTRSTHRPPQTIKQAKAEYKKYGPRISSQEQRQLDRGGELFRRAERIKDAEKKRRALMKRKQDKEQKDREERRRAVRGGQSVLEGFLAGVKKPSLGQAVGKAQEETPAQSKSEEPWEDEIDDGTLIDSLVLDKEPLKTPRSDAHFTLSKETPGKHDSPVLVTPTASELDGAWDDLLISNTQIERELKTEDSAQQRTLDTTLDPILSTISTQDVTLSMDDLQELGLHNSSTQMSTARSKERDKELMPPPPIPQKNPKATTHTALAPRFALYDFDLSSQDMRDMCD